MWYKSVQVLCSRALAGTIRFWATQPAAAKERPKQTQLYWKCPWSMMTSMNCLLTLSSLVWIFAQTWSSIISSKGQSNKFQELSIAHRFELVWACRSSLEAEPEVAVATRTEPRAAMLQQSSWPHTPLLPSALRVPNFDAKSRHCMTLQNVPPNRIHPVLANRSGGQKPSQRTARRPASLSPAEKEGTKIRGIKSLNQRMGKKSNY